MEALNMVLDIGEHILRRCLMVFLFHDLLTVKERYRKGEKLVEAGFVAFMVSFYLAVNYIPMLKRLLYGDERGLMESRASIIPMFVSLLFMLLYCLYFYGGEKRRICYLVFTVYTINELTLFTLHSFFTLLLEGLAALATQVALNGNSFVLEHFETVFSVVQLIWNISYEAVFFVLYYYSLKFLKKNLRYTKNRLNSTQELFLAVPSVMGLCFCILLRSILYAFNDGQIIFLMDDYPETRALIPAVAALCLALILLSTSILKKLVESSEKEVLVEVYKNQISDMEEHMRDVEHLYDGIRGMRHDMKNYMADLELLLKKEQGLNGAYKIEMQQYLDGMCNTMKELDMKCSTGNPVTDVVISRKIREAEKEQIPFSCNFIFPEKLNISAFDISVLLNNGLDNALEASAHEKEPFVQLNSCVKERMFLIEIRNRFTGRLPEREPGGTLKTSKPHSSAHGLGIKNMKNCAEKYLGALKWDCTDGEFVLTIMLQGKD